MKFWTALTKAPLKCFIGTAIFLQFCAMGLVHAQVFKFNNPKRKNQAIDFELIKNLIVIPVYINNLGPFNFILDTGVNPMIITDPALVDSLKLVNMRSVKINGYGDGGEIDAFFTGVLDASIGASSIKNIPTVVLKEDVFNLSSHLGKKISGLIGYNFFQSFAVRVNYISKRVSFGISTPNSKFSGEKLALEFLDNKPYINTKIKTDQHGLIEVKLIVDCGASHALSLEIYQENAFPFPKETISGNLGIGLGGEISGNIGRIQQINLGNYTFTDVLTSFPKYGEAAAKTKQKQRNGNLGSEILNHFTVTYDYQNQAMYLKKNDNFSLPFEHDMSGMEIYIDNKYYDQYYIGRIEEDSPAEKAGLLINDEITAINFRRIETYSLDELSAMLKSANGKAILIEIWRKDRTHVFLLKLKRRI